jgi:hypothetical protein
MSRFNKKEAACCSVSPVAGPYLHERRELPQNLEGPGVRNRPECVRECEYVWSRNCGSEMSIVDSSDKHAGFSCNIPK